MFFAWSLPCVVVVLHWVLSSISTELHCGPQGFTQFFLVCSAFFVEGYLGVFARSSWCAFPVFVHNFVGYSLLPSTASTISFMVPSVSLMASSGFLGV